MVVLAQVVYLVDMLAVADGLCDVCEAFPNYGLFWSLSFEYGYFHAHFCHTIVFRLQR